MARILLVDDDPAIVHMLELTLAIEGYETESVRDGTAAMARLAGPPADLVILDVMMAEVDGYRVLEALRADDAWRDVKVVVCSALGGDDDVWRGWSAGADYYLVKPFDLDHLRDVVVRLLSGSPVM